MNTYSQNKKLRIGETLLQQRIISPDQLNIALTEQKKCADQLGKILVRLGFVSEAVLRDLLNESLGRDSIDVTKLVVDAEVLQLIPQNMARRHTVVPISLDKDAALLTIAMVNVFDVMTLDQISAALNFEYKINAVLATENEINTSIDNLYGFDLSLDGILHEMETGEIDYLSLSIQQEQYSHPLVRLVDALLADAVKRTASDIHFEPEKGFLRIRYRIDGVLQQIRSLHHMYWSAIAVRLKVMANLNIAETRMTQDGRITLTLSGRLIDFRVSTYPTVYGENIVLRVLDQQKSLVSLEDLEFTEKNLQLLKLMIARPEGIILITGPTGSGKTTTLYSILNHLNTEEVNIMTLEDPVEYVLGQVRQSSINEAVKLDFTTGIRAMMRQDPDIILVGEIRDKDTAEMGFRAAMTGHQVYSTLHTNSAIGAIPRLLDIGLSRDILSENIIGIIGQRLVRRLCVHCKEAYTPTEMQRQLLNLPEHSTYKLYQSIGCEQCGQRGYKGRLALVEIVRFDESLQEVVAQHKNTYEIRNHIKQVQFDSLAEEGIRRILEGITSLEEVARVVDLTHYLS